VGAQLLLALQPAAGNQAVTGMVQRWREETSGATLRPGTFAPVRRQAPQAVQTQLKESSSASVQRPAEAAPRRRDNGLPFNLKTGIEALSGFSMDDVAVHYDSPQPAQLNALAYARGSDIHVAAGQEQHLPHEAWHVVQQAQGRVPPTMQTKDGLQVNRDTELEREADVMGAKAHEGIAPAATGTTTDARARDATRGVLPANGGTPYQLRISNPVLEGQLVDRHKLRLAKISQIRASFDRLAVARDVAAAAACTSARQVVERYLQQAYERSIKFEWDYLWGASVHVGNEKPIGTDEFVINWDIDDAQREADKFRDDATRAYNIRQTLRKGAAKYRANQDAKIPELYAGTVADANEINNNANTSFSQLINDGNWFTDTGGAAFVRHARSRSAMIGFSPAGENYIPLHIGHRNL
jgi:hypothetical protein